MNFWYIFLILPLMLTAARLTTPTVVMPGITSVDYYDKNDEYGIERAPKSMHWSRSNPSNNEEILSERWNPSFSRVKQEENIVEISKELFRNLGSITDLNELHQILGIHQEPQFHQEPEFIIDTSMKNAFDVPSPEVKSTTDRYLNNPQQAHCQPELKSIDLGLINTNGVTYYPTCVRVNQCGGCCPNKDVISCQPVESEKVVVKVLELSTNPTKPTRSRRRRDSIRVQYNTINVTVEEHTQCECLCKVKENDCDLNVHHYDEQSCACLCRNKDEAEKCVTKSSHVWRAEACQCLCRKEIECSSSEKFDHATCTCISTEVGISLNNVLLRKAQPWEQIYRHRKPSQALKLEGHLCKEMGILTFGTGRCKMPPVR